MNPDKPVIEDYVLRRFSADDLEILQNLTYNTVKECYKPVYPKEAIDFFINHHSADNILYNAENGYTILLFKDEKLVATGNLIGNIIGGMFVELSHQTKGYGKIIMQNLIEKAVKENLSKVFLNASLPSKKFYDSLGFYLLKKTFVALENNKVMDYYEMEKNIIPGLNYNKKKFRPLENHANGDVSAGTLFEYFQEKSNVWGNYAGGTIKEGRFVALSDMFGCLDMEYEHICNNGDRKTGKCFSVPEISASGLLRLHENWQWTCGDKSSGFSILKEVN